MQAEISSFTLDDKVYPLREAVPLNIEETKNLRGMHVLHNQDYLILSTGHTIEEALEDAATQLAMIYHAYMRTPEHEMSRQALVYKNKLKKLVD
jgi:hypothetical protein